QAGARLHQRVVAGLVAQRPGRAERTDVAVDEARVERPQRLGAEAEPLRAAWAQALDEDVPALDETEQDSLPARLLDVERERALGRVRRQEHHALAVPERRSPAARLVAALGML